MHVGLEKCLSSIQNVIINSKSLRVMTCITHKCAFIKHCALKHINSCNGKYPYTHRHTHTDTHTHTYTHTHTHTHTDTHTHTHTHTHTDTHTFIPVILQQIQELRVKDIEKFLDQYLLTLSGKLKGEENTHSRKYKTTSTASAVLADYCNSC